MANNNIDDVTSDLQKRQGERLKQEMKARKLSRYDICDLINREAPATVTRYCKGETAIPDDVFTTLADAWGLRVEYLQCDDDFKTEDIFYDLVPVHLTEKFWAHCKYLKILGFELRPYILMSIMSSELRENWGQIKDLLTDSALQELKEMGFFDSGADLSTMITDLELKALPDDFQITQDGSGDIGDRYYGDVTSERFNVFDNIDVPEKFPWERNRPFFLSLGFSFWKDEKHIHDFDADSAYMLFDFLDANVKTLIESLFESGVGFCEHL